jgi:hypothetical protein
VTEDVPGARALRDVVAERMRQVAGEGWTAAHDDRHASGELANAAACYALTPIGGRPDIKEDPRLEIVDRVWPWWNVHDNGDRLYNRAKAWWKPSTRRRDLVKAAALILAEIERLDRAEARG